MLSYHRVYNYPQVGESTRLHLPNTPWAQRVIGEIQGHGYRVDLDDCTDLEIRPAEEIQNAQALLNLVA